MRISDWSSDVCSSDLLPTIDPAAVRAAVALLADPAVDIATLACPIADERERTDPNVVKAVIALGAGGRSGRAPYFSRAKVQIGRASRRERVGQYGSYKGVAVMLKQQINKTLEI